MAFVPPKSILQLVEENKLTEAVCSKSDEIYRPTTTYSDDSLYAIPIIAGLIGGWF